MEILRCENLSKVYGKGEASVNALSDVSFSVEKGEFVSIIGPSGSGKSTLLHILGGVDKPTSGKVMIDGPDIHSLKESALAIFRRRHIGLVYQFYNLMPVLNVDENIVLPHLLDGRDMDYERLNSIVDYLGLTDRRRNLPSQLSGGQQQRVSIGRAIYTHPAILLADEPTGNLDRKNGEDIIRLLKDSNRRYKQTLILITHDESIALQADRMLYIEDGRIVRDERIRGGVQKTDGYGSNNLHDKVVEDEVGSNSDDKGNYSKVGKKICNTLTSKEDIKDKTSLDNNGDNDDVYGGGTDEE